MLVKVRYGVFETNSSSMHSISIGQGKLTHPCYPDNVLLVPFGEFGHGYEELVDPLQKLSYVLTAIQYYDSDVECDSTVGYYMKSKFFVWLQEAVKEHIGNTIIPQESNEYWKLGYIDHQSTDLLDDIFYAGEQGFKKDVIDLIFNDKNTIVIDCD